jgi:hypothetical protein
MKKIFLMLLVSIFSIGLFADDTTCRVYGSPSGNIATVVTPVVTSSNSSKPTIGVEVKLTHKEGEGKPWTVLVLRIYDGNEVVKTETISINPNFVSSGTQYISVPQPGHTYFVRLASASCQ